MNVYRNFAKGTIFRITVTNVSDLPQLQFNFKLQFNFIHPAGPGLGICISTSLSRRDTLRILAFLYRLLHM